MRNWSAYLCPGRAQGWSLYGFLWYKNWVMYKMDSIPSQTQWKTGMRRPQVHFSRWSSVVWFTLNSRGRGWRQILLCAEWQIGFRGANGTFGCYARVWSCMDIFHSRRFNSPPSNCWWIPIKWRWYTSVCYQRASWAGIFSWLLRSYFKNGICSMEWCKELHRHEDASVAIETQQV